jgi:hypothetical protein
MSVVCVCVCVKDLPAKTANKRHNPRAAIRAAGRVTPAFLATNNLYHIREIRVLGCHIDNNNVITHH